MNINEYCRVCRLDNQLLNEFREKINENNKGYQIFRDYEGKNKWGVICSAMDWLEVSLDGIDLSLLSNANTNEASIKMITFLSCIDTMWEAITQIHRVFYSTSKIPFGKDRSVFNSGVSDNIYFKTIRACFAAHQINLQKVYLDDEQDERWFASWSGGGFSRGDFSVILYSNVVGKESRFLDIKFDELMCFAEKRYQYLKNLMNRFREIVTKYQNILINTPIEISDNVLERIDILTDENKKRWNNDYYDYELSNIRVAFEVNIVGNDQNRKLIEEYRNRLLFELDEIANNIQNMISSDLKNEVNTECPCEYMYPFSKLSNIVMGDCREYFLYNWIVNELKSYLSPLAVYLDDMTPKELYVLFQAVCYKKNYFVCKTMC